MQSTRTRQGSWRVGRRTVVAFTALFVVLATPAAMAEPTTLSEPRALRSTLVQDPNYEVSLPRPFEAVALQSDGGVIIRFNAQSDKGMRASDLARLASDGSLDEAFNPMFRGVAWTVTTQFDKRLVLTGELEHPNGTKTEFLRLNADGTVDESFQTPKVLNSRPPWRGVTRLVPLRSGKYLIFGLRIRPTQPEITIIRLRTDGRIDPTFKGINTMGAVPESYLVLNDGSLILSGTFSVNGVTRKGMARIDPNGALDRRFNPPAWGVKWILSSSDDGAIYVDADFRRYGRDIHGLARILPSGSIDDRFRPRVSSPFYLGAIPLENGALLAFGSDLRVDGRKGPTLVRINSNGTLDRAFVNSLGPIDWIYPLSGNAFLASTAQAGLVKARVYYS